MKRIPIAGPWITQKEVEYVADAAANAWYENAGLYNQRFEKAFANYVGRRFAMSLPSCTSAIHLSLLALDVGPGDEVIVPDITWIASAAPINYVGATPVFADVDPQTWCLSPDSLVACISSKTKAIIVVDLYGGMPDMARIQEIADKHRIALIEDAAEAVGSEFRERKAGSFGASSVFSFHGSKTLTTGEGGMLVTDDQRLAERAQVLRDHGRHPGDNSFFNREVGYKYKMSSLQAALGLAQLERVDELIERKRVAFSWYQEMLRGLDGLTLNYEPPGTKNAYWMVTAIFDSAWGGKQEIARKLKEQDIDSRPFFNPLSSLPAYANLATARVASGRNAVSYRLGPNGVNLPSALALTREQVEMVCAALVEMRPR